MTSYKKADPRFKVGDRVVVVSEYAKVKLDDNSGLVADEELTYEGWIAVQVVGPVKPSPFTSPGHTCWPGCHWEDVVR